ncbi:MAG: hypothetical protein U0470_00155 [Anaerolineae bacterium]
MGAPLRDFTAMVERHRSPWHGHRLGLLAREILGHWRAWHRGEIDRATLTERTAPLRARFEQLLDWTARNAPGRKDGAGHRPRLPRPARRTVALPRRSACSSWTTTSPSACCATP